MTRAELMTQWVRVNHRVALKFFCTNDDLRSIDFYLSYNKNHTYESMIMMYGIIFYLACIEYFITVEDYERCSSMVKAIEFVNHNYKIELPTSFHSEWVSEHIHMSPTQLLKKFTA